MAGSTYIISTIVILIILGIVALVKWIANQGKSQTEQRSRIKVA